MKIRYLKDSPQGQVGDIVVVNEIEARVLIAIGHAELALDNQQDEQPSDDSDDKHDEQPSDDSDDKHDEQPSDDSDDKHDEQPSDDSDNQQDEKPSENLTHNQTQKTVAPTNKKRSKKEK